MVSQKKATVHFVSDCSTITYGIFLNICKMTPWHPKRIASDEQIRESGLQPWCTLHQQVVMKEFCSTPRCYDSLVVTHRGIDNEYKKLDERKFEIISRHVY